MHTQYNQSRFTSRSTVPQQQSTPSFRQATKDRIDLKGHGLFKKIGGTHRWQLTQKGRRIVTALLAARQADVDKLTQLAA